MKWLSWELQPLQPLLQSIRLDCTGPESSQGFWETWFQFSPLNTLYFLSYWRLQEEIDGPHLMVKDLLRWAAALNRRRSEFQFQLLSSFLLIISLPCLWTPPVMSQGAPAALSNQWQDSQPISCGWFYFLQQNLFFGGSSCFRSWLITPLLVNLMGKDYHLNEGGNYTCICMITWSVSLLNWCMLESISEQWTICLCGFLWTRQNILIR